MITIIVGCLLSIAGAVLANLGLVMQKLATTRESQRTRRLTSLLGWFSFLVGQCVVWASLSMIPASIGSLLSSFSILSNAILAPLLLHEKLTWRAGLMMILIILGSILAVVAPKLESSRQFDKVGVRTIVHWATQPLFVLFSLFLLIGILSMAWRYRHQKTPHVPLGASLFCATLSIIFAKCCAMLLADRMNDASLSKLEKFLHPALLILFGFFFSVAFGSIFFLNRALHRGSTLLVLPIYYAGSTVTSVIGSLLFFEEYLLIAQPARALLFLTGTLLVLVSSYQLAKVSADHESESRPLLFAQTVEIDESQVEEY